LVVASDAARGASDVITLIQETSPEAEHALGNDTPRRLVPRDTRPGFAQLTAGSLVEWDARVGIPLDAHWTSPLCMAISWRVKSPAYASVEHESACSRGFSFL